MPNIFQLVHNNQKIKANTADIYLADTDIFVSANWISVSVMVIGSIDIGYIVIS